MCLFMHSHTRRLLSAWLERDPVYGEACSIYCLDTEQLVCPSALLNSENYATRSFKRCPKKIQQWQQRAPLTQEGALTIAFNVAA